MLKKYLLVSSVLATIAVISVVYAYSLFFGSGVKKEGHLYISSNISYFELADSLRSYVKHPSLFDIYAKRLNLENSYKKGYYKIDRSMSIVELVRKIKLGMQEPVDVAINNVRTMPQLAGKLSHRFEADSMAFLKALTSTEIAQRLGFTSETFFSMFIPNTYEVYWSTTPEEYIARMAKEYKRFWNADREAKRKRLGLTRVQVMTLASIIYEETAREDEMARIASVYVNRLRIGMPLQADPTVKYAMGDFSIRRVLYKHLKHDSPYNTYLYRGLPPAPICMPSVVAIDAALNPEKSKYLYFCARPSFDGYHNFAKTLSEHNNNARKYSAELNRRNIK